MIYFISDGQGHVKIGCTRRDVSMRVHEVSKGPPRRQQLRVLRTVEGGKQHERWFHQQFASVHVRGDWFLFDPEMLTIVAPKEIPAAPMRLPLLRSASNAKPEPLPEWVKQLMKEVLIKSDRVGIYLPEDLRRRWEEESQCQSS